MSNRGSARNDGAPQAGDADGEAEPSGVGFALPVEEYVADAVRVFVGVCVWLRVAVPVAVNDGVVAGVLVDESEADTVAVADCVAVTVTEGERVTDPVPDDETVAAEVPEGASDRDCVEVGVPLPVAVADDVCGGVPDDDSVADAVRVGDIVWLDVTVDDVEGVGMGAWHVRRMRTPLFFSSEINRLPHGSAATLAGQLYSAVVPTPSIWPSAVPPADPPPVSVVTVAVEMSTARTTFKK